jgi:hypothetical protein
MEERVMDFVQNYLGIGIMVIGGLFAVLGVLLLLNHNGGAKIIIGIVMAAAGLAGAGVGYTIDQKVEVTYTVSDITAVSARDSNNVYRVKLVSDGGVDTWIYLNDNQLPAFPQGEKVTLTKRQLKVYTDQGAAANEGENK